MNQAFATYPPHKPLRTMITRIARKECIEMICDGRFRWAAGIVFALLTGSLIVGWKHYANVEALYLDRMRGAVPAHAPKT